LRTYYADFYFNIDSDDDEPSSTHAAGGKEIVIPDSSDESDALVTKTIVTTNSSQDKSLTSRKSEASFEDEEEHDSVEVERPVEQEEISPEEQKALFDDMFNGSAPLQGYDETVTFRDSSPLHNEKLRKPKNPQGFNYASIYEYASANADYLADLREGCYLCKCGMTEACVNDVVVVRCGTEFCSSFFYHGSCLCTFFLRRRTITCPMCSGPLELLDDIKNFKTSAV